MDSASFNANSKRPFSEETPLLTATTPHANPQSDGTALSTARWHVDVGTARQAPLPVQVPGVAGGTYGQNIDSASGVVYKSARSSHYEDAAYWALRVTWRDFFLLTLVVFVALSTAFTLLTSNHGDDFVPPITDAGTNMLFHVMMISGFGGTHSVSGSVYLLAVMSIESLVRLVFFAVFTGLLFARFARPISRIRFTRNMIITKRQSSSSAEKTPHLMFRVASDRLESLINTSVQVTLSITEYNQNNGQSWRTFHELSLKRSTIPQMSLPWTIMHEINNKSKLYGLTHNDLIRGNANIFVIISAMDLVFGGTIWSRSSYNAADIFYNYKYQDMFETINGVRYVDMSLMDIIEPVDDDDID